MIHQLLIYKTFESNKDALHARFRDHPARIMGRYEPSIFAMWEAKRPERIEFAYLLRWPDEETKARAAVAFMADQEWENIKKVKRDTDVLVGEVQDRPFLLTDYSPIFA